MQFIHTRTSQAERSEAKLNTIEHDEAVGGIQLTGLLWVTVKIAGALPEPQLPDLPYVDWRRKEG